MSRMNPDSICYGNDDGPWIPFTSYADVWACNGYDNYEEYGKILHIKIIHYENNTIAGVQFVFSNEKIVQFAIIDNGNQRHCGYHRSSGSFAIDPSVFKKIIGFNLHTICETAETPNDCLKFSCPEDVEKLGGNVDDCFDYVCGGPKKTYQLEFSKDGETIQINMPCYKFYWRDTDGFEPNLWRSDCDGE